jgi:hypothetical protein
MKSNATLLMDLRWPLCRRTHWRVSRVRIEWLRALTVWQDRTVRVIRTASYRLAKRIDWNSFVTYDWQWTVTMIWKDELTLTTNWWSVSMTNAVQRQWTIGPFFSELPSEYQQQHERSEIRSGRHPRDALSLQQSHAIVGYLRSKMQRSNTIETSWTCESVSCLQW